MKSKNLLQVASAVVLVAGFIIAGFAQNADESEPMDKPTFESLDKDSNGAISRMEAADSWLEASFASVDTNRDGNVSKDEYNLAVG
jgi:hypothetical protein